MLNERLETKVRLFKGKGNLPIETFVETKGHGADMALPEFELALCYELGESLAIALADEIGNPTLLVTRKMLTDKIIKAMESVLNKEVQGASTRVLGEMKRATIAVAGAAMKV